ncbi:PREDICTED: ubiquitin thioesterase otulin [Dipodomys ordii]|uniref:Ubiquitin thioesterase otulin n=1 Tax=Dipodomys ordii TaxID=10020 RepID=A0A1S3EZE9_DIPOR|nr:PREDICTED: ubiquitin thioesterase otulin [Dipodomys ordii]
MRALPSRAGVRLWERSAPAACSHPAPRPRPLSARPRQAGPPRPGPYPDVGSANRRLCSRSSYARTRAHTARFRGHVHTHDRGGGHRVSGVTAPGDPRSTSLPVRKAPESSGLGLRKSRHAVTSSPEPPAHLAGEGLGRRPRRVPPVGQTWGAAGPHSSAHPTPPGRTSLRPFQSRARKSVPDGGGRPPPGCPAPACRVGVGRGGERAPSGEGRLPTLAHCLGFQNGPTVLNPLAGRCRGQSEEDIYRAADEIEKEKELLIHERGASELRLSVAPEMDIMDYCKKEWRGNTQKAICMKKGYEEVSQKFTSIRRVRGDNYCALRATLFQAMSQLAELPPWLQDPELTLLPEKLIRKYSWIKQWKFGLQFDGKSEDLVEKIKESLILLRTKWAGLAEMRTAEARQIACDELFTNEEEYSLYEAVKFLMLNRAIELYDDKEKGKEVPFFSVLLFARDTSNDPGQLLRNHLNQVGHTGGLEQVEMFLLAYAVRHTIQVYRLSKFNTEEFITVYPTDAPRDWPVVTLIAEDDRHYNVPVRVCEETSL